VRSSAALKLSHYCGSKRGIWDGSKAVFGRGLHKDFDLGRAWSGGISDATYYTCRKQFGAMAISQLSALKSLEKENQRLKKIVAALELDALIMKESLDFLKLMI
jgi:putative transposase